MKMLLGLFVGCLLVFAGHSPAEAQEIKNNKKVEGRIDKPEDVIKFTVKLDKKYPTLHILADCDTTELVVFLKKDGKFITLFPDGEKGRRTHGDAVAGFHLDAIPWNKKFPALDKGEYTITVGSCNQKGTGDFSIRLPDLPGDKEEVKRDDNKKDARPETKAEMLSRLKKELEEVRARETKLVEQIRKLESEGGGR